MGDLPSNCQCLVASRTQKLHASDMQNQRPPKHLSKICSIRTRTIYANTHTMRRTSQAVVKFYCHQEEHTPPHLRPPPLQPSRRRNERRRRHGATAAATALCEKQIGWVYHASTMRQLCTNAPSRMSVISKIMEIG